MRATRTVKPLRALKRKCMSKTGWAFPIESRVKKKTRQSTVNPVAGPRSPVVKQSYYRKI